MKRTITVRGVGTVSAKPDYIVISMTITSKDLEYTAAVDKANDRIKLLREAIESAGFAKNDLKIIRFDVNTNYESEPNEHGLYRAKFAGYACRYELKLSMDMDSKRLAKTLTAISGSGADAELNIKFTVKDPEKISAELLRSATENARQKAEILCAASGVKLGDLITINYGWNDSFFDSASNYAMDNELSRGIAVSSVPEFEPEDIQSSDSATFVWEIE